MKRILAAALAATAILVVSCDQGSDGDGDALSGTTWRLSSWSAGSPDPSEFTITAAFDGSRLSGTSAVNSYSGTCSTTAGGGSSVGELQSTEMAGSVEAMRAERTYLDLLVQVRKYAVSGATLTLLDGGGRALLVFAASR